MNAIVIFELVVALNCGASEPAILLFPSKRFSTIEACEKAISDGSVIANGKACYTNSSCEPRLLKIKK